MVNDDDYDDDYDHDDSDNKTAWEMHVAQPIVSAHKIAFKKQLVRLICLREHYEAH